MAEVNGVDHRLRRHRGRRTGGGARPRVPHGPDDVRRPGGRPARRLPGDHLGRAGLRRDRLRRAAVHLLGLGRATAWPSWTTSASTGPCSAGCPRVGSSALRAALLAPDRVRALILLDTQAGPEDAEVIPLYQGMIDEWVANGPSDELADASASLIIGEPDAVRHLDGHLEGPAPGVAAQPRTDPARAGEHRRPAGGDHRPGTGRPRDGRRVDLDGQGRGPGRRPGRMPRGGGRSRAAPTPPT